MTSSARIEVVRGPDGVALTMSEGPAQLIMLALRAFAGLLRGERTPGLRRTFGIDAPRTPSEFLEWLFPDVYPTSAAAAGFRARHGVDMRAELLAATNRVLGAWAGNTRQLLSDSDVDDWLMVTGVAQFVFARRPRVRPSTSRNAVTAQQLLGFLQANLVLAVCPEVDEISRAALKAEQS